MKATAVVIFVKRLVGRLSEMLDTLPAWLKAALMLCMLMNLASAIVSAVLTMSKWALLWILQ
jgi:hypothetical protein